VFKHILIPTDGSDLAQKAVQQGLELAGHLKAAVTAITVTVPWPVAETGALMTTIPLQDYRNVVTQLADEILARSRSRGQTWRRVRHGACAERITCGRNHRARQGEEL
jgi:nucleotide-binding universal stress UspA family protein